MATSPARTKRKSPSAANVDPAKKASAPDPADTGTSTIRLSFVTASFHRGSRAPRPVGPRAPWTPQASVGQVLRIVVRPAAAVPPSGRRSSDVSQRPVAVASLRSPLPLSRLAFYGSPAG